MSCSLHIDFFTPISLFKPSNSHPFHTILFHDTSLILSSPDINDSNQNSIRYPRTNTGIQNYSINQLERNLVVNKIFVTLKFHFSFQKLTHESFKPANHDL